ncbi:MAG: alpha/beta hydrolase [bacterium]|nr:alpha/beta hydrolase [bacterium]
MPALWKLLVGVLSCAAILRGCLFWFERANLYFPTRRIEATPAAIGLPYEDVTLETADGVRIHGWFIPGTGRGLLFFHGNAGNISHRFDSIRIFHELGLQTLIIDYRGYGLSGGRPSERGLSLDADAAYDHLRAREGIDPDSLVAFGRSLGGAVAADLAARRPLSALIVESAFTSTADIARDLLPLLPARLLVTQRYDSIAKVPAIRIPKLFIHSRDDEIIPFRHGRRLYEAAAEPRRLFEMRGGHNDAFLLPANRYPEALERFLLETAPPAR